MSSRHGGPGPVELGVEGGTVLPAAPDDAQPGASEDADGVWMATPSVDRTFVNVNRPGVRQAAAIGEVHDGGPQFLVARPTEDGPLVLP